jgi:hypothetical protein
MPPPGSRAPKLTIEEAARNSFGTAFRSAKKEQGSVRFVLVAPEEGTPEERYRRAVIMAATVLPTAMRVEPSAPSMNFTVLDPKNESKHLVVFTVDRTSAGKLGGHGSPDALLSLVRVLSSDPEFKQAVAHTKPQ